MYVCICLTAANTFCRSGSMLRWLDMDIFWKGINALSAVSTYDWDSKQVNKAVEISHCYGDKTVFRSSFDLYDH